MNRYVWDLRYTAPDAIQHTYSIAALYENGKVIGGLGVSGDTSCADHVIAYRMRRKAGFDQIPGGPNTAGNDNIEYPSSGAPTGFQQPHCSKSDIPPSQI